MARSADPPCVVARHVSNARLQQQDFKAHKSYSYAIMSDDQVRSQQPLPPPSRVHCVLLTGTWCTHRQKMSYGAVFLDQVKDKKDVVDPSAARMIYWVCSNHPAAFLSRAACPDPPRLPQTTAAKVAENFDVQLVAETLKWIQTDWPLDTVMPPPPKTSTAEAGPCSDSGTRTPSMARPGGAAGDQEKHEGP